MSQVFPTIGSAPQFPATPAYTNPARTTAARGVVTEAQVARAIARGRRLHGEAVREVLGGAFRRVLHPFAARQRRHARAYGDRSQAC